MPCHIPKLILDPIRTKIFSHFSVMCLTAHLIEDVQSNIFITMILSRLTLTLCYLNLLVTGQRKQPNIIFILADDLGWNDVSWHNPEMPTTRMEKLAEEGLILEQSYSQQVCTPSRAALLTGRYPFNIGRQKGGPGWVWTK